MPKKPINQDVQKIAELAMAKSLKDAKDQAQALMKPVIEHLFKMIPACTAVLQSVPSFFPSSG